MQHLNNIINSPTNPDMQSGQWQACSLAFAALRACAVASATHCSIKNRTYKRVTQQPMPCNTRAGNKKIFSATANNQKVTQNCLSNLILIIP